MMFKYCLDLYMIFFLNNDIRVILLLIQTLNFLVLKKYPSCQNLLYDHDFVK